MARMKLKARKPLEVSTDFIELLASILDVEILDYDKKLFLEYIISVPRGTIARYYIITAWYDTIQNTFEWGLCFVDDEISPFKLIRLPNPFDTLKNIEANLKSDVISNELIFTSGKLVKGIIEDLKEIKEGILKEIITQLDVDDFIKYYFKWD